MITPSPTSPKPQLPKDTRQMLESLRQAVLHALEKKKRLGQYAVIWKNGKVIKIGEDIPKAPEDYT
ncbi:MAG: hypothetical protein GY862_26620 [Gammaproteobacteria bacterium]|nr:hypothetical protein [Gammaproteobacteria bacterium]